MVIDWGVACVTGSEGAAVNRASTEAHVIEIEVEEVAAKAQVDGAREAQVEGAREGQVEGTRDVWGKDNTEEEELYADVELEVVVFVVSVSIEWEVVAGRCWE